MNTEKKYFEVIPSWDLTLKAKNKDIVLKANQTYKLTIGTVLSLPPLSFFLLKNGTKLYGEPLFKELDILREGELLFDEVNSFLSGFKGVKNK